MIDMSVELVLVARWGLADRDRLAASYVVVWRIISS